MRSFLKKVYENCKTSANSAVFSYAVILMFVFGGFIFFYSKPVGTDIYEHSYYAYKFFSGETIEEELAACFSLIPWTYPVYHILVWLFSIPFSGNYMRAAAVVLSLSIIAAAVIYRYIFQKLFNMGELSSDLLSLAAVVFSTVRSPLTGWRFYAMQGAPNVFHNPTILIVRPIGLMMIYFFCMYIAAVHKGKPGKRELILFSVFTFLSVIAKPNFAAVFLPAMGLYTLCEMFRARKIGFGMRLLLAVLPSAIMLLVQLLNSGTQGTAFSVSFGSFSNFTPLEVLEVSLATFPIPILALRIRYFKRSIIYTVSYLALAVGWMQMFFLTDGWHGNFSWGYDLAVNISTVVALCTVLTDTGAKSKPGVWFKSLLVLIFTYQVISGILYLVTCYNTGKFWI